MHRNMQNGKKHSIAIIQSIFNQKAPPDYEHKNAAATLSIIQSLLDI